MGTNIALKQKISDLVTEYETKKGNLENALEAFKASGNDLITSCTVNGVFGQVNIDTGRVNLRTLEDGLRRSAWLSLHKGLNLDILMSANDKKRFEQSMSDLPEFTMDNIRSTFGDYILDPWSNILRGLAEVFCSLDQSYKSHEKVKIGVDGLPKRIILSGFGEYGFYGWERLADVVNALASYQNKPILNYFQLRDELKKDDKAYLETRGFELRRFKNGNAHMIFTQETLKDINRALAQYYGEVLADCYEEKPEKKQQSTYVSKDLQYYPTPQAVVDRIVGDFYSRDPELILEPSCGCGRFMDALVKKNYLNVVHGIEVDPVRAEIARSKGHKVQTANFLETHPTPKYDRVVMNPPFYGKHYAKHIEHALKFLKDGGVLTAILPITAKEHGLVNGKWSDLPFGSFRESGTNINTTVLTIFK